MIPSKKALDAAFPGKGKVLRTLLESNDAVRAHPAALAYDWVAHEQASLGLMRLHALDVELGGYGIEAVWHAGHGPETCSKPPAFEYVNMGDLYNTTIIRYPGGRYRISDVGSIIERGNYE